MTEKTTEKVNGIGKIFQELQEDYQAHAAAWRQAIDKNHELTPEEKELLNGRVNPILKELQATLGLMFNTLEAGIVTILNEGKNQLLLDKSFANRVKHVGMEFYESLSKLSKVAVDLENAAKLFPKFISSLPKMPGKLGVLMMAFGVGMADTNSDKEQSVAVAENILGALIGIAGGAALAFAAPLVFPVLGAGAAAIATAVMAGIAVDLFWEYGVSDKVKEDMARWAVDVWNGGKSLLVNIVENGSVFVPTDTDTDQLVYDQASGNTLKQSGNELAILSDHAADEYVEATLQSAMDTDVIEYFIAKGQKYVIAKETDAAIIRNNLDNIASESFVTANVLIKAGEILNLGNGKNYYKIKAGDTVYEIARAHNMKVQELLVFNPWLIDEGRVKFYKDKLIIPESVSLVSDKQINHRYGDEQARASVETANTGSDKALTVSGTGAQEYFADFDGGNDRFYGSARGGDIFAGGKGNDRYYLYLGGTLDDTVIDKEGDNRLYIFDEKGKPVRITGGQRNKETMPDKTFVSDDGQYVFHVDEENNLSIMRMRDVEKMGDGDLKKGVEKMTRKKAPSGQSSSEVGSSGQSSHGSDSGTASGSGGSSSGNSVPSKTTIPNYKNGQFGINLDDDPREEYPYPPPGNGGNNGTPSQQQARTTTSPIIIDLNGDGIGTVARDSDIIRFDLDNNGFAERTGWVDATDGFLVRDLSGNGRIDNGGELFGNHTKLVNGKNAANGFEALKELDSNQDGQINQTDAVWRELKIWQDANQDGYSAHSELKTLEQVGIISISTAYQSGAKTDSAGNIHKQIGTAKRSDGGNAGVVDVWFVTNLADTRQVKGRQMISSEISPWPEVYAFGNVADLSQAMMNNAGLQQAVMDYLAADDKQRRNQINSLIYLWTGAEKIDSQSRGGNIDARKLAALEALTGELFLQFGITLNPGPNAGKILTEEYDKFASYVAAHLKTYNNHLFIKYIDEETGLLTYDWRKLDKHMQKLFTEGKQNEIVALAKTARDLSTYNSSLKASWLNYVHVTAQSNAELAALMSAYLVGTEKPDNLSGTSNNDFIGGEEGNDTIQGGAGNDTLNGGEGNDTLHGESGKDILIGGTGNDQLYGGDGDDTLHGQEGSDTLDGWGGHDILDGGAGDDILKAGYNGKDRYLFRAGHGHDLVDDAASLGLPFHDDIVFEGANSSDAVFTRIGLDLIIAAYGSNDSVRFKHYFHPGSSPSFNFIFADRTLVSTDIATMRFTLSGTAGDDKLDGWFSADELLGSSGNDTLVGKMGDDVLDGGGGNDLLYGESGNDTLTGGTGDDQLSGGEGNDTLKGQEGNDTLDGWSGYDILDGGIGDDILKAGYNGKDRYLFRAGHGHDLVDDAASLGLPFHDDIVFEGANSSDAVFTRIGLDLIIAAYGSNDSVRFKHYFHPGSSPSFNFIFADRTLVSTDIATMRFNLSGTAGDDKLDGWVSADELIGGSGNDALNGKMGDDTLHGGEGNDQLYGESGKDILIGGTGNDYLDGGAGSDTYVFGKGFGQDRIHNYDGGNSRDTVRFEGLRSDEVSFRRQHNDLILSTAAGDTLTVSGQFAGTAYAVDRFEFADASFADADFARYANAAQQLVQAMAAFGAGAAADASGRQPETANPAAVLAAPVL